MHNIQQFVQLLKDRKFPIEGMRMEVQEITSDGSIGYKGIVTLHSEETFTLKWCNWHCFLSLVSQLRWSDIFTKLIPCCLGITKEECHQVDSEFSRTLEVLRSIK